eukprot:6710788-Prymnesium_polylepis.1
MRTGSKVSARPLATRRHALTSRLQCVGGCAGDSYASSTRRRSGSAAAEPPASCSFHRALAPS